MSALDEQVFLDGELVESSEARISPFGAGFMAGYGVFETISLVQGKPVFFPDHWERLQRGLAALQIRSGTSAVELERRCTELAKANRLIDGSVKVVIYRDEEDVGELIVGRRSSYLPTDYERGFQLMTVSDVRRLRGAAHKTLNYLKSILAREAARASGADDALFVNGDGQIYEGAATNVFIVKGQHVLTPPAECGILPGVARAQILRRWPGAVEREITLGDLANAEEVFVTNALLGVMPVSRVDRRVLAHRKYSVVPQVRQEFLLWQAESVRQAG